MNKVKPGNIKKISGVVKTWLMMQKATSTRAVTVKSS